MDMPSNLFIGSEEFEELAAFWDGRRSQWSAAHLKDHPDLVICLALSEPEKGVYCGDSELIDFGDGESLLDVILSVRDQAGLMWLMSVVSTVQQMCHCRGIYTSCDHSPVRLEVFWNRIDEDPCGMPPSPSWRVSYWLGKEDNHAKMYDLFHRAIEQN